MGKSICKGCNNKFATEETVVIKGKKYCSTCSEQVYKELKEEQERAEQEKAEKTKAKRERSKQLTFICDSCENTFSIELAQKTNGVYRCPTCYNNWREDVKNLNTLRDYIYEKQGGDKNKIVLAGKLIQDYVKENGLSYKGIYLTLKYFVEEKNGDIKNGIGVVPYIYEEAREYFSKRRDILLQLEELKEPPITYRTINFKAETRNPRTNLPDIRVEDIQV